MTGRSLSSGDRYPYSSSRSAFSIFRGDLKIVCMLKVEIFTEVVWKLIWENFVPFLGGIKAHQSIEIMRCIRESFITKTGRNTQFRFKISFFAIKHLFHLRWKLKLFCIKTFGQVLIFLFVCVLLFIHV